jgi:hypothetical protein
MTQEEYQDSKAYLYFPGFKEPAIILTVTKEFIASFGKNNLPNAGTFVLGDAIRYTFGDYILEFNYWNEKERLEEEERQAYMNERGYKLEQKREELESQLIQEESDDFKRWKEERNKELKNNAL